MRDPSLTLVVPCYNEEKRLDTQSFLEWVSARPSRHLLLVDDASTDHTAAVLDRLRRQHSRVSVLRLGRNHGKAGAVRAGVLHDLASDLVGFWDADLSAPLSEVDRLVDVLVNNPALLCVAGIRVMHLGARIERSFVRHVLGRVFATVASSLLKLYAYDTQCGAKLFRRDAVGPLFGEEFVSRRLFDIELYLRLRTLTSGARLDELVHERTLNEWKAAGRSSLRWRDFVRAPVDLVRIHRRYR